MFSRMSLFGYLVDPQGRIRWQVRESGLPRACLPYHLSSQVHGRPSEGELSTMKRLMLELWETVRLGDWAPLLPPLLSSPPVPLSQERATGQSQTENMALLQRLNEEIMSIGDRKPMPTTHATARLPPNAPFRRPTSNKRPSH